MGGRSAVQKANFSGTSSSASGKDHKFSGPEGRSRLAPQAAYLLNRDGWPPVLVLLEDGQAHSA